ncbi:L-histidine Nalpha-methyltransferase [Micromonospora pattaloongensis]|uniref:Histidine N-alpha-methyltransferase n=1 Tax=Micromonospora pattaloongensis TaxID=405436 RepID=A0A1H3NRV5_9ACTN|nr:L-histidine N(alpha)-methyltransferase [Micromonospora pattaloongensis]SDY91661.1 L-histidine Nalpha-methyltransferase [Micromonospora pattaloongensis]
MNDTDVDVYIGADELARTLAADAAAGLTGSPKWLPPTWFYDARGSRLFDEITRLPEYYPTRAERTALRAHADEIAAHTGTKTLVELGSGSSDKTRLLLDALRAHGSLGAFVPLDVSETALRESVAAIAAEYPALQVHGVVGDFTRHLRHLPRGGTRTVAFLGGTIGNLLPGPRARLLAELRDLLEPGEWLLLGADLVKDPAVLVPAYDDALGVTAEFNRNVLHVLNRELGADFDPGAFDHVARWDPGHEWIEMRLRARTPMRVRLPELGVTIAFDAGEELLTEVSAKFRRDRLTAELATAGFAVRYWWTDPEGLFSLSLSRAEPR